MSRALQVKYSEAHRHYHNANHIKDIFNTAKRLDIILTPAQKLAIQYHDVIYFVGSNTNEYDSAEFMLLDIFPEGNESSDVRKAYDIILATAKHAEDQPDLDDETKLVLDLDISSMASMDYIVHMLNIAKECNPATLSDWIANRLAFINKMLARKKLFYTDYFDETFARYNLTFEQQMLLMVRGMM